MVSLVNTPDPMIVVINDLGDTDLSDSFVAPDTLDMCLFSIGDPWLFCILQN